MTTPPRLLVELDRGGPSYTADTLAELALRHPGAHLFTILGEDAAAGECDRRDQCDKQRNGKAV